MDAQSYVLITGKDLVRSPRNLNVVEFKCFFNDFIKISMFQSKDQVDEKRPIIKWMHSNLRLEYMCNTLDHEAVPLLDAQPVTAAKHKFIHSWSSRFNLIYIDILTINIAGVSQPGLTPQEASMARKRSILTGKSLEQDHVHIRGDPADWMKKEQKGAQMEDRLAIHHANIHQGSNNNHSIVAN